MYVKSTWWLIKIIWYPPHEPIQKGMKCHILKYIFWEVNSSHARWANAILIEMGYLCGFISINVPVSLALESCYNNCWQSIIKWVFCDKFIRKKMATAFLIYCLFVDDKYFFPVKLLQLEFSFIRASWGNQSVNVQ